jgi:hypothetical protein
VKRTLALLGLVAAIVPPSATADGLPVVDVEPKSGGLGADVQYTARWEEDVTVLTRTERRTRLLLASNVLRGRFEIPVVAYDGSPDGLSADGRTLVLISPRPRFPRRSTTFAVVDARTLEVRKRILLRGDYSFDAISPRGRWIYVIHYTSPKDPLQYEVLALDLRTAKLHHAPIVDPREPDEKMNGHPLTRRSSRDGRWAYTLYEGADHPFVHALDTQRRTARCIDLDWLHGHNSLRRLRFELRDGGDELALRKPDGETVAVVDTATFEASAPSAAGPGSWPKTALSALALVVVVGGIVYVARSRSAFS